MKRLLLALLGIALLATVATADTDSFTFKNNTGKDANDLHIEWSRAVTVTKCDKFKKFTDREKSSSDFSKGDVANGDTCEVTVTYDGTDPKVKSFYWTKDGKNIGKGSLKDDLVSLSIDQFGDVTVATLTTSTGTIRTYLPDDIRAGDTISGTVIHTPDPLSSTASTLQGTVIEVGGKKASINGETLLVGIGTLTLANIVFKDPQGRTIGTHTIPINTNPIPNFNPGQTIIGQSGRPLTVPFNSDPSKPSMIEMGGNTIPALTCTPRNITLMPPPGAVGAQDLKITSDGMTKEFKVVLIDLKLTAPKTTLMKGEQTNMTIALSGLQGLSDRDYPLTVRLQNDTPSTILLADSQAHNQSIVFEKSDVNSNGVATRTLSIQAQEAGSFKVSGNIAADTCGDTKTILKIERLSKGKDKDGFFIKVRRDTYEGKCYKKKGHSGEHGYAWKKSKNGDEEVTHYATEKERDDAYKSLEEAKAKIEKEMAK